MICLFFVVGFSRFRANERETKNHPLCGWTREALALRNKTTLLELRSYHAHSRSKEVLTQMDEQSLAHTRWECKYHVVFAPKYRRQVIYGKLRRDISQILIELCRRKEVEIIEAEACADHIHMLITIPPKYSVSQIMGYLKGKSSLIIFDRHANLKYKYGNRHFWCRGYYVSTVGKNEKKIRQYIVDQLKEDHLQDQISLKEYIDPFTGDREEEHRK